MAEDIKRLAETLGARIIDQVPDAKGGAFGAARLSRIVEAMLAYRDKHGPVLGDDLTLKELTNEGRP